MFSDFFKLDKDLNMNNASHCNICNDPNTCTHKTVCGIRCVSWSGILIGAFIAVGLSFLLNLFSVAIGLSTYHMGPDGAQTLAVGGLIGFAIGIIAIMYFSGWVAGFLGRVRCSSGNCGSIYGLTMWCVALVLTV